MAGPALQAAVLLWRSAHRVSHQELVDLESGLLRVVPKVLFLRAEAAGKGRVRHERHRGKGVRLPLKKCPPRNDPQPVRARLLQEVVVAKRVSRR